MEADMRFVSLSLLALSLSGLFTTGSEAAERSYEQCRDLAIARGVAPRYATSGKIEGQYLRYKAAGTALHPRGLMARCMSGRS
jgi:hypothetical protein